MVRHEPVGWSLCAAKFAARYRLPGLMRQPSQLGDADVNAPDLACSPMAQSSAAS
jgi:hypothetical protein